MNIQEWLLQKYPTLEWGTLIPHELEDTLIGLHILIPTQKKTNITLLMPFVMNNQIIKYGYIDKEQIEYENNVILKQYNNIKEWQEANRCHIHR